MGEGYRTWDVELLCSFFSPVPKTFLKRLQEMDPSSWSSDHSQGYAWTHRRLLWGPSFPGLNQCRSPLMTSCPKFRDPIGYSEARVLTFQLRHCGGIPRRPKLKEWRGAHRVLTGRVEKVNMEKKEPFRDLKGNLLRGKCGEESRQRTLKPGRQREIKFSHLYR